MEIQQVNNSRKAIDPVNSNHLRYDVAIFIAIVQCALDLRRLITAATYGIVACFSAKLEVNQVLHLFLWYKLTRLLDIVIERYSAKCQLRRSS